MQLNYDFTMSLRKMSFLYINIFNLLHCISNNYIFAKADQRFIWCTNNPSNSKDSEEGSLVVLYLFAFMATLHMSVGYTFQ
jgi:hypothetical protein